MRYLHSRQISVADISGQTFPSKLFWVDAWEGGCSVRYMCDVLYVTLISPEAKRKETIKAALRRQKEPVWAMQDVSVKAYWLSDVGHESYCTKHALV